MRFWITRNGELPIRDQLVRQVVLGILSDDLPPGHKLPSVRALARRHQIHSNTVSSAYHDLLEQGWLELRRGSGIYVRASQSADRGAELDRLLTAVLHAARASGYEPSEVVARFTQLTCPRTFARILVAEPDPGMSEILRAEIGEHLSIPVEVAGLDGDLTGTLVVALPTRFEKVRRQLPTGAACVALKLRSVRQSLEGEARPDPRVVVSIVSRSPEIRQTARAMLIAVGLSPDGLSEIDASEPGWQTRVAHGTFVVTDVVSARELPARCVARVFRVISDSSIAELVSMCQSGK